MCVMKRIRFYTVGHSVNIMPQPFSTYSTWHLHYIPKICFYWILNVDLSKSWSVLYALIHSYGCSFNPYLKPCHTKISAFYCRIKVNRKKILSSHTACDTVTVYNMMSKKCKVQIYLFEWTESDIFLPNTIVIYALRIVWNTLIMKIINFESKLRLTDGS